MKRYFEISVHGLIGTAFLALMLTGRLDAMSMALFLPGFLLSLYRTGKGQRPLLTSRGAFYLSCAYIAVFLFDLSALSGTLIGATVHMVLFLELAKMHQEKTDKDYLYLILLAFVKILAASSLTVDMSFVLTLLLFVIAFVSTLMSFEIYRSQRAAPEEGSRESALSLGGMSVWTTFWIIVFGTGLFFVIPRVGTGYFTRAAISPLLISGFNDDVKLGQIGQLKLSSAVVMHAKRLTGVPGATLKWRGVVLDTFNGRDWKKQHRSHSLILNSDGNYPLDLGAPKGELASYEILLEPLATTALFGPYRVRQITGRAIPGIEKDNDDAIFARFQGSRRLQYQVQSDVPRRPIEIDDEKPEPAIPEEIQRDYLQLPDNLDPEIRRLALQITSKRKSLANKANLVELYLKQKFKYTLTLDWNPGDQPLSTFLFKAKKGHCEYFASSMAVLLRSIGIPTRLVNGFQMGEYNPAADAYIVRQSDAHSWVEVYLPESGWTEFDPTPGDSNHHENSLLVQLSNYGDAIGLFWNTYVLTYDTDSQAQLFRSAQDTVRSFQRKMQGRTERLAIATQLFADRLTKILNDMLNSGWIWLYALAAIASFVLYKKRQDVWNHVQATWGKHSSAEADAKVVSALFYRAVKLAESEGPYRSRSQTWREWVLSLPHEQRRNILSRAVEIFERSKYGRQTATRDDVASLRQAVHDLRALLQ
jgi:transglutaminase-like putative cysteine protease